MTVLTVAEAAERLRVSKDAIYDACKAGQLRHLRINRSIRIPEAAFDEWVKGAESGPQYRILR